MKRCRTVEITFCGVFFPIWRRRRDWR